MVARLSVSTTGLPHEEQKRTLAANSVSQVRHLAMKNSRYSLQREQGIVENDSRKPRAESRKPLLYYHAER